MVVLIPTDTAWRGAGNALRGFIQLIGETRGQQAEQTACLSQGFYFCTNMTKKQVGEERVCLFSVYFHIAVDHQRKSGLELKRARKQELMQRP